MEKQNSYRKPPMRERWKINSNGYGGQILAIAGIFIIALPLGLYFCSWLLHLFGVENLITPLLIKISFAIGAVITGLFLLLLAIEFIQDRILDKYYFNNKEPRLQLADGHYECPYCGARNIRETDTQCPICGKSF